jgi:hypothetical protein
VSVVYVNRHEKSIFKNKKALEARSRPIKLRSEPAAVTTGLPSLHWIMEEADTELVVVWKPTQACGGGQCCAKSATAESMSSSIEAEPFELTVRERLRRVGAVFPNGVKLVAAVIILIDVVPNPPRGCPAPPCGRCRGARVGGDLTCAVVEEVEGGARALSCCRCYGGVRWCSRRWWPRMWPTAAQI